MLLLLGHAAASARVAESRLLRRRRPALDYIIFTLPCQDAAAAMLRHITY